MAPATASSAGATGARAPQLHHREAPVSPQLHDVSSTHGHPGGGQYRIINNTAGSIGPRLALFRDQPPMFNWRAASRYQPTASASSQSTS